MTKTRGLGVAAVFLAGCAVGGASARFVVPAASAQQAATLTKWEYSCFAQDTSWSNESAAAKVTSQSTQAGAQGWEMAEYSAASGASSAPRCERGFKPATAH